MLSLELACGLWPCLPLVSIIVGSMLYDLLCRVFFFIININSESDSGGGAVEMLKPLVSSLLHCKARIRNLMGVSLGKILGRIYRLSGYTVTRTVISTEM